MQNLRGSFARRPCLAAGLLLSITLTVLANPVLAATVEELQAEIESNLSPGAQRQEVEAFLRRSGWDYAYDPFSMRFQARQKEDADKCVIEKLLLWLFYDCSISILLNLNEQGEYIDSEIEQTYTGL